MPGRPTRRPRSPETSICAPRAAGSPIPSTTPGVGQGAPPQAIPGSFHTFHRPLCTLTAGRSPDTSPRLARPWEYPTGRVRVAPARPHTVSMRTRVRPRHCRPARLTPVSRGHSPGGARRRGPRELSCGDHPRPCIRPEYDFPSFNRKCGLSGLLVSYFSTFSTPVDGPVDEPLVFPAKQRSLAHESRSVHFEIGNKKALFP